MRNARSFMAMLGRNRRCQAQIDHKNQQGKQDSASLHDFSVNRMGGNVNRSRTRSADDECVMEAIGPETKCRRVSICLRAPRTTNQSVDDLISKSDNPA